MRKKSIKRDGSPFRGYSNQEIFEAERDSSVIEVGGDLYCEDGAFSLPHAKARGIYEKILLSLLKMINDGSDKERKEGLRLIHTLRLKPLRIH